MANHDLEHGLPEELSKDAANGSSRLDEKTTRQVTVTGDAPETNTRTDGIIAESLRQLDYHERLAYFVLNPPPSSGQNKRDPPRFLAFDSLHRVSFQHLQKLLMGEIKEVLRTKTTTDEQMDKIRNLLHAYCDAARDIDWLGTLDRLPSNPKGMHLFKMASGHGDLQGTAHIEQDSIMLHGVEDSGAMEDVLKNVYFGLDCKLRATKDLQDSFPAWLRFRRCLVAITGGAVLIVPVLIMVLHPSGNTNLVTLSVSVLLFAIIVGSASKASNQELLGAVAAYAAVLVVFVGTSAP